MKTTKLVWNVYREEINQREIQVYNIFDHYSFYQALLKIKKDYKKAEKLKLKENSDSLPVEGLMNAWRLEYKEDIFTKAVKTQLLYYYWSKCEHEIVITSWPPYISAEEMERLDLAEHHQYRYCVNLEAGKKVDVYDQVMLNFGSFIDYLWNNLDSLKEKK